MDVYKKNICSLAKSNAEIINILESINGTCNSEDGADFDQSMKFYSDISRDNNKYLVVEKDEQTIRLNSSYRPIQEAQKWAMQCFEDYKISRVITVYGFGNGYCLREICKKLSSKDLLIVYEPFKSLFKYVLSEYDISDIIDKDNVYIIVGKEGFVNFKEIYRSSVGMLNVKYSYELVHPQYDKIDSNLYLSYLHSVVGYKDSIKASLNTMVSRGRRIIECKYYGLKRLKGCNILSDIKDTMTDKKTMIIVSAGPSLEKNAEMLKKAKNHALIVCTDTAYNTLCRYQVVPDALVTVCSYKNMHVFKEESCKKINLFCAFSANMDYIEKHNGKRIYYDSDYIEREILTNIGKKVIPLEKGGSVATSAMMLGIALGMENIIFVGQDLAYGDNEMSHAGGVKEQGYYDDNKSLIEGMNGKMVQSRPDWIGFLGFIEDMIMKHPHINFVDATQGGALIHGTKILDLDKALELYATSDFDYDSFFRYMPSSFTDEEIRMISNELDKYVADLNNISIISEKVIVMLQNIVKKICDGVSVNNISDINKMYRLFNEINEYDIVMELYSFAMKDLREYVDIINKGFDNEQDMYINHFESYKKFFEKLVINIPKLIDVITGGTYEN